MKQRYLYTYSGRIIHPGGSPSLEDIAVSLSRECRYAGGGVHWWPVALHTFVVCDMLPTELRIHGLLHDACEAITGDVPKPVKSKEIEAFEDELTANIYRHLELEQPTKEEQTIIHEADQACLYGEVWTVGTHSLRSIYPNNERAAELVDFYRRAFPVEDCVEADSRCVKEFLWRFNRYTGRGEE